MEKKHSFTTGKKISAKWSALSGRYLYYRSQDYSNCGCVMRMESHTTKKQITEIKSDWKTKNWDGITRYMYQRTMLREGHKCKQLCKMMTHKNGWHKLTVKLQCNVVSFQHLTCLKALSHMVVTCSAGLPVAFFKVNSSCSASWNIGQSWTTQHKTKKEHHMLETESKGLLINAVC